MITHWILSALTPDTEYYLFSGMSIIFFVNALSVILAVVLFFVTLDDIYKLADIIKRNPQLEKHPNFANEKLSNKFAIVITVLGMLFGIVITVSVVAIYVGTAISMVFPRKTKEKKD